MAQQALNDCAHLWGSDLQLSPTGDLARSSGDERSKEHVLRRLLTGAGSYLSHVDYGAGLPGYVGSLTQGPALTALIRGQMQLEASVSQAQPPVVTLTVLPDAVSATISYVTSPEQQPVALAFTARS